jgi:MFS family permease
MRALRTALQHAALRRLLLAFVAVSLGTWAFAILVSLYAYAEVGAIAVGVAVVARTLPAAVVVPSVAMLADRHSRRIVLVVSAGVQALVVGAVALAVALAAPFTVVLALAAIFMVAGGASNPARAATAEPVIRDQGDRRASRLAERRRSRCQGP